jgi:FAD/FMN-containing dehydrogenase
MYHGLSDGVPQAALRDLARGLQGQVLVPGSAAFEDGRRVWNAMVDRTPAVIVRCSGTPDVVTAIAFAREHNLLVSVRGGGHNVVGHAVCDGGLVVDLSPIAELSVDPAARTADAGAGLTWGPFDRGTQAHGLATTGGLISTTGIAGLTLGGGLGWLMRRFGLACDNLLSAEVVTADGRILTASAAENPELFWCLRGGGGNFGVVTRFTYRLHPVGPVLAGMVLYPFAAARAVLRRYRDAQAALPDEATVHAALLSLPGAERAVALLACWSGDLAEGERILAPLRALGAPLADTIRRAAYTDWQSSLDVDNPPGLRNYWKSALLGALDDTAIDTLVEGFGAPPSVRSNVLIEGLGGAFGRVPEEATAFGRRDAAFDLLIAAVWEDRTEDARQIGWARDLFAAMAPYTGAQAYVNYLGPEEGGRVRGAYGEATYARLVALKDRYDPGNLFRLNQNIPPSRWSAPTAAAP